MAIRIWRGDAQSISQQTKVTVENVEIGDIFAITVNLKSISYTAEAATAVDVYGGLAAAIAAENLPEFPTAAYVAATGDEEAHLLLTSDVPFTATGQATNGSAGEVAVEVVVHGDPGTNMVQRIALPSGTGGGTFTLSFQGQETGNLTYDESAADIETALEGLTAIGSGNVTVSGDAGGPWLAEFTGDLGAAIQPLLAGDGGGLTGQTVVVSEIQSGLAGTNFAGTITIEWNDDYDELTEGSVRLLGTDPWGNVRNGTAGVTLISEAGWQSVISFRFGVEPENIIASVQSLTSDTYDNKTLVTFEATGSLAGKANMNLTATAWNATSSSEQTDTTDVRVSSAITSAGGDMVNEVQLVTIPGNPSGGTFTLTYLGQTTSGIAYNADAATVETALENLSSIGSGNVLVTDNAAGGWRVEFTGGLAATNLSLMTATGANLTGGAMTVTVSRAAIEESNERVSVTIDDAVTSGTFTLSYDGDETSSIAYNATAGTVQTALEGLDSIGSGDVSVSGSPGGPWTVEFTGTLAGTNVGDITADATNLVGASSESVTITNITTPTGPFHWDNADNWSGGAVPVDGDTVIFEHNENPVLYGLDQSDVTLTLLIIRASYTGQIGLPPVNEAGYIEYRDRYLQIGATAVRIGEGEGTGSDRINIDFGSVQTDITVHNSATPAGVGQYAVNLKGTHASNALRVYQGSVGVAPYASEEAVFASIDVGFSEDQGSDVELYLGDDVQPGAMTVHGGLVTNAGRSGTAITSVLVTAGDVYLGGTDGVTQLDIEGGTVRYRTNGTLGGNTVVSGGGTLTFEGDLRPKTVTNAITCQGNEANVLDPQSVVSSLTIAYESTSRFPELGTNFTVVRS